MIIDGKILAEEILQTLQNTVETLKKNHIVPTIAVILVGDDPGSASYIRQKEKAAKRIGAELKISHQPLAISPQTIEDLISQYNDDQTVHGIIIQRPLPQHLQDLTLLNRILPSKDIDGFVPDSKFQVPVARAVEKILETVCLAGPRSAIHKIPGPSFVHQSGTSAGRQARNDNFYRWLSNQNIVVIGKGETAGKPIAQYFSIQGCNVTVIHSQTSEAEKRRILAPSDIIISCVGKKRVIKKEDIQNGVILISVGIWRDSEGKLHGDYEEDEIKNSASFYTPTPGGVGPVNVACLMENLIVSASNFRTDG